jgi:nucleoside-diphosphate-sugar epimerase
MRSVTILGLGRSFIGPPLLDLLSRRYDSVHRIAQMQVVDAEVVSLLPMPLLPARLATLKGTKRLVALSSTWVHTRAGEQIGIELAAAESEVRRFCAAADITWTFLRPTMMYRPPHDPNITVLARFIRRYRVMPLAGYGRGLRQPVYGDDVAQAVADALRSDATANRSFELPGGETLRFRDIVRRIFQALGLVPLLVPVPTTLLSTIAPPLWRHVIATMNTDMMFDVSEANAAFGYYPRAFDLHFPPNF